METQRRLSEEVNLISSDAECGCKARLCLVQKQSGLARGLVDFCRVSPASGENLREQLCCLGVERGLGLKGACDGNHAHYGTPESGGGRILGSLASILCQCEKPLKPRLP